MVQNQDIGYGEWLELGSDAENGSESGTYTRS